jgi:hypothetical protein
MDNKIVNLRYITSNKIAVKFAAAQRPKWGKGRLFLMFRDHVQLDTPDEIHLNEYQTVEEAAKYTRHNKRK